MGGTNGALTVRINDGVTDRHVTRFTSDLRFTKIAPGGHKSIQCHVDLPRNTFNDLGPADRIYVYDARTGLTVIEGYLDNPEPTDGVEGQAYDLTAVGGMALANDETRGLVYIEQNLDAWIKDPLAKASSQTESGVWAADLASPRERVTLPDGTVLATNDYAGALCDLFRRVGMNLGALTAYVQSGKVDTGYRASFVSPAGTVDFNGSTITTTGAGFFWYVGTQFPAATNYFALRLRRTGGLTTVGDDKVWTDFVNLAVLGQRMDRNGTLLTTSAGMVSAQQVLASQVVEDLLGRLLTFCDPGTAVVDATTFGITQLSYPDGVKAADVLNDLDLYEPGFTWEIGETLDNGKHRFAYRAWPTTARYVVSVKDGWRQTGGDVDLCNRILVSWTDPTGQKQVTPVTAASLGLSGIGLPVDALGTRIKDAAPISLSSDKGSAANATRVGGQVLADRINPPKAGTVTVSRPIVDLLTGNTVMPWEIEPGYLCQVRETGDLLRITQVDYADNEVAATLTLGLPELTTEQRTIRLPRAA